ncbi:hypothetical protein CC86DRAFT_456953 [Ophiobolus disseminans]|uniref:Uncharacterized protein n=1 Tax=Ophiobolus disseminans TaxID=1469910 RepID=A0A6A6ZVG4_9PLEO|nr:hypothetical protein CC86DRAFT_456953 [Ophiobolus disseminans]
MSADLFAEFADPSPGQQQPSAKASQPTANFSFFDTLNSAPGPVTRTQPPFSQLQFQGIQPTSVSVPANDNDDWGDFEGGSSQAEPTPSARQDPFAFVSTPSTQPVQKSKGSKPTVQDPFVFQPNQQILQDQSSWQKAPVIKAKKSADPSVLFDAEDDLEDDDDFGDFEGTDTKSDVPAPSTGSSALVDLLGNMNVSRPESPAAQKSGNNVVPDQSLKTAPLKKGPVGPFGSMARPEQGAPRKPAERTEDDGWDTFDDWEASIATMAVARDLGKVAGVKATSITKTTAGPPLLLSPATDEARPGELPPTNVPPPGVLLSLFPSLFADAQERLFKPMAAQTLPMRNKLMAEPATIAYLQGYLVLSNVAAHIIAGRKLRWKRDQHLSQGMRIGPASSRATSGMKLTGIDKGENLKEEREVSDVVRAWKEQVGRLRHVVSGANQIKAGTLGQVADLQETMPVKSLKQSEGGIPARQPCMMCGLKREERVTAADMATGDSFGEWWIDQVNMHRGCRNFWNQHKDTLRQR